MRPYLLILISSALILTATNALSLQTTDATILLGVRFGPSHQPCKNVAADCSSPQAEATRKIDAGGGPEWGFVDQTGRIIHSGYRMVLTSAGQQSWGFVHREHLENGRPMPIAFGWALLHASGATIRPAYRFGKSSDDTIPGQSAALFDVGTFSEGLAAVDSGSLGDDKWGYVDELGRTVIPGKYDDAKRFSEGLAAVRLQPTITQKGTVMSIRKGAWIFIDKNGTPIDGQFESVSSFSEGLAAVRNEKGWGYIDQKGHVAIETKYADAGSFSENRAATRLGGDVQDDNNLDPDYRGRWGYVDRTGKAVIAHQYSSAGSFSQGLATACKRERGKESCGAVDSSGEEKIPFVYQTLDSFREGLAVACKSDSGKKLCGAIDPSGATRIPFIFQSVGWFADGVSLARLPSGKKVFIDRAGRPLGASAIERSPDYEDARGFRNGLAAVKLGGLWGFIDRTGSMAISPQFLDVAPDWRYEFGLTGELARYLAEN